MKNTLYIVFSLLISLSTQAQSGCGFNYKSDVAQFFATMGDSYHCNMVEVNRVNKEVVLKCDHVLGSSYVKDLKVSQEFVDEHLSVLSEVPMNEKRKESRKQRIFRKAIMTAYKGKACLDEQEFSNRDKESIKDKFVAAGDELQKDIEELVGLSKVEGSLAEVEIFDGNRYPKPELDGFLTGRVPDEDDSRFSGQLEKSTIRR